ncbi:MAG: hypothetical protein JO139_13165 [Alphaproteobacteria bacterium]|nr:hypothetical protein [Alphaproteobacteria bacterium]MBV8336278.1 hypothetical protein [Alphaproteobacteria bacterium]
MAGLDPATHDSGWQPLMMTYRRNRTLYAGSTTDLARRSWKHRTGVAEGFTKQYGLNRLVYAPQRLF